MGRHKINEYPVLLSVLYILAVNLNSRHCEIWMLMEVVFHVQNGESESLLANLMADSESRNPISYLSLIVTIALTRLD